MEYHGEVLSQRNRGNKCLHLFIHTGTIFTMCSIQRHDCFAVIFATHATMEVCRNAKFIQILLCKLNFLGKSNTFSPCSCTFSSYFFLLSLRTNFKITMYKITKLRLKKLNLRHLRNGWFEIRSDIRFFFNSEINDLKMNECILSNLILNSHKFKLMVFSTF